MHLVRIVGKSLHDGPQVLPQLFQRRTPDEIPAVVYGVDGLKINSAPGSGNAGLEVN
jgi:hypothetical protein